MENAHSSRGLTGRAIAGRLSNESLELELLNESQPDGTLRNQEQCAWTDESSLSRESSVPSVLYRLTCV
jgi:hypothetical protein